MPQYIVSVGMEVHAELQTKSKMFCRCPVEFGGMPNTRTCPVCLGLPGTLPVPNHAAVEMVIKTALALNCTVPEHSIFHRKNYFYPDLPKGFQVSQYGETNPIGYNGYLEIPTADSQTKRIKIRRVHLEEDTGKLMHLPGGGSGVDYNRAGVPLMEIVTDFPPDIQSAEEAKEYMVQLRAILMYLGVCDGKLEQGSMRCEPNISIREAGSETYGTKTELKNLNSFRSVQLGIEYEAQRQAESLAAGKPVLQETRGWNEQTLSSYAMRVKETEADYRYFPCPDLTPMHLDPEYVQSIRMNLPELPLAKRRRYQEQFGLSDYDSGVLVADRTWAEYFERSVDLGGDPKAICNWMNGDFARLLNERNQSVAPDDEDRPQSKVEPAHLVELVALIERGEITGKTAKAVFEDVFETGESPANVVKLKGLGVISDTGAIEEQVRAVIAAHPGQAEQFRAGKDSLIGFFVGQVMRRTEGRADPKTVQELIRKELS